jgi:hypothetical protein
MLSSLDNPNSLPTLIQHSSLVIRKDLPTCLPARPQTLLVDSASSDMVSNGNDCTKDAVAKALQGRFCWPGLCLLILGSHQVDQGLAHDMVAIGCPAIA